MEVLSEDEYTQRSESPRRSSSPTLEVSVDGPRRPCDDPIHGDGELAELFRSDCKKRRALKLRDDGSSYAVHASLKVKRRIHSRKAKEGSSAASTEQVPSAVDEEDPLNLGPFKLALADLHDCSEERITDDVMLVESPSADIEDSGVLIHPITQGFQLEAVRPVDCCSITDSERQQRRDALSRGYRSLHVTYCQREGQDRFKLERIWRWLESIPDNEEYEPELSICTPAPPAALWLRCEAERKAEEARAAAEAVEKASGESKKRRRFRWW